MFTKYWSIDFMYTLLVYLSVCLCGINVKTIILIGPIVFVTIHMTPWER